MQADTIECICLGCANSGIITVTSKPYYEAFLKHMFKVGEKVPKCIKCESEQIYIRDLYTRKIRDIEWI